MHVVVTYDISEDKRRTKIHKILSSYGQWMQFSVFECSLTATQYAKLRNRLNKLIKSRKTVFGFISCASVVNKRLSALGVRRCGTRRCFLP